MDGFLLTCVFWISFGVGGEQCSSAVCFSGVNDWLSCRLGSEYSLWFCGLRFGIFFGCLEGWFFCGLGGGFLSRFFVFVWYSLADGPAGWIVAAYAAGYKIEHFKVKIIVGFVLWFILALFCGGFAR